MKSFYLKIRLICISLIGCSVNLIQGDFERYDTTLINTDNNAEVEQALRYLNDLIKKAHKNKESDYASYLSILWMHLKDKYFDKVTLQEEEEAAFREYQSAMIANAVKHVGETKREVREKALGEVEYAHRVEKLQDDVSKMGLDLETSLSPIKTKDTLQPLQKSAGKISLNPKQIETLLKIQQQELTTIQESLMMRERHGLSEILYERHEALLRGNQNLLRKINKTLQDFSDQVFQATPESLKSLISTTYKNIQATQEFLTSLGVKAGEKWQAGKDYFSESQEPQFFDTPVRSVPEKLKNFMSLDRRDPISFLVKNWKNQGENVQEQESKERARKEEKLEELKKKSNFSLDPKGENLKVWEEYLKQQKNDIDNIESRSDSSITKWLIGSSLEERTREYENSLREFKTAKFLHDLDKSFVESKERENRSLAQIISDSVKKGVESVTSFNKSLMQKYAKSQDKLERDLAIQELARIEIQNDVERREREERARELELQEYEMIQSIPQKTYWERRASEDELAAIEIQADLERAQRERELAKVVQPIRTPFARDARLNLGLKDKPVTRKQQLQGEQQLQDAVSYGKKLDEVKRQNQEIKAENRANRMQGVYLDAYGDPITIRDESSTPKPLIPKPSLPTSLQNPVKPVVPVVRKPTILESVARNMQKHSKLSKPTGVSYDATPVNRGLIGKMLEEAREKAAFEKWKKMQSAK